jgi:chloramphenicol O-acetyltransferase type A
MEDFESFSLATTASINKAKHSNSLKTIQNLDLIYVSVIPWRSFTSLKHPRSGDKKDSVPRIVFGKVFEQNGKFMMPVTVDAHHSLVDGFHVSKFFNRFEELLIIIR